MNFNYDKDTDTLYINFIDSPGSDSFEIAEDYIADTDAQGNILGIEVLNVRNKFDFKSIVFNSIPFQEVKFVGQP